ncbi:MAG: 2-polyprenyl-3-methyl-6-methoxy-1,4-benzoquinone monooxygenase [Propionivibrio sp.]
MSLDATIVAVDKALRTLFAPVIESRKMPGRNEQEPDLTPEARSHAGALMRVNHVGEVCAQALYQGQGVVCRDPTVRASLDKAAEEEIEHLAWTAQRIKELGSRASYLNPCWYAGAFVIGVVAGKFGDAWSLGFLAETERQVGAHLDGHLRSLPEGDTKSRAVVVRMRDDEIAHAQMAVALGARDLPLPVRYLMRATAKVMTRTAYYV